MPMPESTPVRERISIVQVDYSWLTSARSATRSNASP